MMSAMPSFARRAVLVATAGSFALALAACGEHHRSTAQGTSAAPTSRADQTRLIDEARATLTSFKADTQNRSIHEMLSRARAVIVFPNLVKGGFIVGAEGGRGVMFVRDSAGHWGQPVFMGMANASLGLQAGVQSAETILVVYSENALNRLLSDKVKLGADVGVTVISAGGGAERATPTNLSGDIAAISRARGLYGGVSVEGGVLSTDDDFNRAYYGRSLTAREIIASTGSPSNAVQAMHSTLGR